MASATTDIIVPWDRRPRLYWVKPLHKINIIGVMGSGKTTLALRLYGEFKRGQRGRKVSVYFQYDKSLKDEFWDAIRSLDADMAYVVVDDISFSLDRPFMQELTRIRHKNRRVRRWALVTNMHYSKAALPFLRQSNTKILTSLTDPEEIENLRWNFTVQALWDYYYLYINEPQRHWVLINWMGQIFVSWFKKPRQRCWDVVVNGPECIE